MTCYSVPVTVAIVLFAARKVLGNNSYSLKLLNLLLAAGSVMLVIDHWWNQELFLLGDGLASDLFLGVLMTLGTVVFWGILLKTGQFKTKDIANARA